MVHTVTCQQKTFQLKILYLKCYIYKKNFEPQNIVRNRLKFPTKTYLFTKISLI